MRERSILLVDDDRGTRELLAAILAYEGYRVCTAETAEEAWSILTHFTPDLFIVDLVLPELRGDGLRALQLCNPRLQNAPFILITGGSEGTSVARAIGAAAFLQKPIDADTIVARVHAVLMAAT